MRLVQDHTPSADNVRVRCVKCGKWFRLTDLWADLDGDAFVDYYCDKDKPGDREESRANK